ncbi:MAG: hypothetical protein KAS23_14860 [Anaerohalosphaera sp.]|nr:hypothetical protein [Anaerohalosphaera sp.]
MNTFIKENEKLFGFYSTALGILGWALLVLCPCYYVFVLVSSRDFEPLIKEATYMPLGLLGLMSLGLLGIGLSQLIRYLSDAANKPGLILLHGNKLLYLYVIFTIVVATMHVYGLVRVMTHSDMEWQSKFIILSNSIVYMVYYVAKALIIIGMAQFLKRLMPVIDEHKSLI